MAKKRKVIKKIIPKSRAANGKGRSINTRYAYKKALGVYVYKLKARKKNK